MISVEAWNEAAALLRSAADLLGDTRKLTPIQLVAAFNCGLETVEELKKELTIA